MSSTQQSPVTPSRKGDGQPTKHILLQKENLVTHDRTWLPARLQPPKLADGVPYSAYLLQYEQYLDALQYMKSRFLETRRFDPSRRRAIDPKLTAINHAVVVPGAKPLSMTVCGLTFGTINAHPLEANHLASPMFPDTSSGPPPSFPVDLDPVVPVVKNVPTPRQQASRKAAKKARRKARARTIAADKTIAESKVIAAKASAQADALSAVTKLERARKKRSKLSPSHARRREKRRQSRLATIQGGPAPPVAGVPPPG